MKLAVVAVVASLGVFLGGCPKGFDPIVTVANPVSPTSLYEGELVFDVAVKTFNELKGLCADRVLPRKCRTYVNQGAGYIGKAWAADMAARRFVQENPTLDVTNAVQAFTGIVSTFKSTVDSLSALRSN